MKRRGIILGTIVMFLVLGLGVFTNAVVTSHLIGVSQHRWCSTLSLLTRREVPRPENPRANPSRQTAYIYYRDFLELRREFCGR